MTGCERKPAVAVPQTLHRAGTFDNMHAFSACGDTAKYNHDRDTGAPARARFYRVRASDAASPCRDCLAIGTTIEWYDFFLYSTVTGLVFAKLFFPHCSSRVL